MSYCAVGDVTAKVPRFIADVPNNPSTNQIQDWIDEHASEIYSRLLNRGIDPGGSGQLIATMGLTPDQQTAATNWLKSVNIKGAVADLLRILEANTGAQEDSEAKRMTDGFKADLERIGLGGMDGLFSVPSRVLGNGGGNIFPELARLNQCANNPGVMLGKFREY